MTMVMMKIGWLILFAFELVLHAEARGKSSGGSSSGCFVENTQVLMANGRTKAIQEIMPGHEVISWDPQTRQRTVAKVVERLEFSRREFMELEVEWNDGMFSSTRMVTMTPEHPIWGETQNGLVSLDVERTKSLYDLEVQMLQRDGQHFVNALGLPVFGSVSRTFETEEEVPVFTLSLNASHYFYAEGIRVHNKGLTSTSSGSGTSSTWTSSKSGGYYTYGGSGYYTAGVYSYTYITFYRPTRYYESETCRRDPYQPGCRYGSSTEIVCGCETGQIAGNRDSIEASADGTYDVLNSFGYELCPDEGTDYGICFPTNGNRKCISPNKRFTPQDAGWTQVTTILSSSCATQKQQCELDSRCVELMNENEYEYYRSEVNATANDTVYIALQQCMTTNLPDCDCQWEVCTDETGGSMAGMIVAAIIGFFVVCCMIVWAIYCCQRNCRMTQDKKVVQITPEANLRVTPTLQQQQNIPSHDKVTYCLQNEIHGSSIMSTNAAYLYSAGDPSYRDGVICDYCHVELGPNVTFHRCALCLLDFCENCHRKRVAVAQTMNLESSPMYANPVSPLEGSNDIPVASTVGTYPAPPAEKKF